jgi:hypothetical protein
VVFGIVVVVVVVVGNILHFTTPKKTAAGTFRATFGKAMARPGLVSAFSAPEGRKDGRAVSECQEIDGMASPSATPPTTLLGASCVI